MNDSTPKSWWKRLSSGLKRTSSSLGSAIADLVTKRKLDAAAIEELEHELIRADLGPEFAGRITSALSEGRFDKAISPDEVKAVLAGEIEKVLGPVAKPLEVTAQAVHRPGRRRQRLRQDHHHRQARRQVPQEGKSVMLVAGDTFRAAAIDQLKIWGERTGATVKASDARRRCREPRLRRARRRQDARRRHVLVDTAGRLQNRTELMGELEKMVRVMRKVEPTAPHAVLLVLDATVGQNALSQVDIFGKIAGVTGLVMTKLDGTARGGILVAIAAKFRPAGAFHRRRRGRRGSQPVHRARFRARHSWAGFLK